MGVTVMAKLMTKLMKMQMKKCHQANTRKGVECD
jgi:hypothetical protein